MVRRVYESLDLPVPIAFQAKIAEFQSKTADFQSETAEFPSEAAEIQPKVSD